ncbi:A/G-specific adenine glycosylase [Pedobacter heparinus]|uniref:Adenine DNA glycosylase n=1 Tax=Pedobacter heparinus (strain ATCC 13125 / DSM 2366 / CIP 104194 / JCM 7457 / NBRC 12017 / NCIMB 9290 / NRRL B-14731 / HIM 762-3) TaxID=485917 RepID=C6XY88_PEDHD|nr:A/G-specific adenine glycosylase [Pedobacter heparinus]ACU02355.1 helix-hairpin-helix motif protein [Pedobacter heparinus DSM 2366]
MSFQSEIVNWYLNHKRDLPWRGTTDAYIIWLSEVILQQTRVDQGLPYFNNFLQNYPTVLDFASASETQVLKLWQGLGYYSRGRNMLFTARQVRDLHGGVFPVRYDQLIKLKGIGEYTAAAIASFSSNESKAVLDGNVFRVLSRYFGIESPINSSTGKKQFADLAQSLISGQQPSVYNQAIMEFGALQCKPKSPNCGICPVQDSCFAQKHHLVGTLPVKLNKLKKRTRYFNYFLCMEGDNILVKKRSPGDIWQELYDFPLIETDRPFLEDPEKFAPLLQESFGAACKVRTLSHQKHLLTHQTIYVQFFGLDNYIINFNQNAEIKWVSLPEFDELPQPKVITNFVCKHFIT